MYDSTVFTHQKYLGSKDSPLHMHPAFNHLLGFIPRNIKDLFDLMWHTFYRAPQISAVLQRKSAYTVTSIRVDSDKEDTRSLWTQIFEDINAKQVLKTRAIDRFVYGSSFHYVYRPFVRSIECPKCRAITTLTDRYTKSTYDGQSMTLSYNCPACHKVSPVYMGRVEDGRRDYVHDMLIRDPKKIVVRRVDPRDMGIEFNSYSGNTRYWYDPPGTMRAKVMAGDVQYISELPRTMLEAIARGQLYAFDADAIYHSKVEGPISPYEGWGLPPMLFVLPDIYHTLVLKRANEAIGMEYIAPHRVVTPAAGNATGQPTASVINLGQWQSDFLEGQARWRVNPLQVTLLPASVEVTQVGGNGRAMLVGDEIERSEANVLAGMGWPRELFYGGTGATNPALLRTIENELINDQQDDERFLRWITGQVAPIIRVTDRPKVSLEDFKLIDDVAQKGLLAQVNSADPAHPLLSRTSLAKLFGVDYTEELARMVEDAELEQRTQNKLEQMAMAYQRRQQSAMSMQNPADPQVLAASKGLIMQQAQQLAQELSQLDPHTRRSRMASSDEDPVVYALAEKLLGDLDRESAYAQSGGDAAQQDPAAQDPSNPPQ